MYLATINVPGYLPMDDDPPMFESAKAAWEYLADERERGEDGAFQESDAEGYSETYTKLSEVAAALDAQSEAEIARLGLNDDGTGVVYGNTPGYDGSHDLGLAYVVTLTEVSPAS